MTAAPSRGCRCGPGAHARPAPAAALRLDQRVAHVQLLERVACIRRRRLAARAGLWCRTRAPPLRRNRGQAFHAHTARGRGRAPRRRRDHVARRTAEARGPGEQPLSDAVTPGLRTVDLGGRERAAGRRRRRHRRAPEGRARRGRGVVPDRRLQRAGADPARPRGRHGVRTHTRSRDRRDASP